MPQSAEITYQNVKDTPSLPLHALITSNQHYKDSKNDPLTTLMYNWWEDMLKNSGSDNPVWLALWFLHLKDWGLRGISILLNILPHNLTNMKEYHHKFKWMSFVNNSGINYGEKSWEIMIYFQGVMILKSWENLQPPSPGIQVVARAGQYSLKIKSLFFSHTTPDLQFELQKTKESFK